LLLARWHTYQVLTKPPDRLKKMLNGTLREAAGEKHIWWGVSVENRKHGLPRIADLQATPAAVRFLSVEPLLQDVGTLNLDGISWVIVGGESGPGARPMAESWVISLQKRVSGCWCAVLLQAMGRRPEKDAWSHSAGTHA
jgi:protein gp37